MLRRLRRLRRLMRLMRRLRLLRLLKSALPLRGAASRGAKVLLARTEVWIGYIDAPSPTHGCCCAPD
jgi:hypothetical protein